MGTEMITKQISRHLADLMVAENLKLEYVASQAEVGIETVRRVKNGQVQRLFEHTAIKLAEFIEEETNGEILAAFILDPRNVLLQDFEQRLVGATIEGEDWSGRNLQGVDLRRARLVGVNLSRANLRGALLKDATLVDTQFDHACLVNCDLQGINAENVSFEESDIRCSSWVSASISHCSFRNANHTGTDMRDVKFQQSQWLMVGHHHSYHGGMLLEGATLEGMIGISQSHAVVKQIVLNISENRYNFKMLAGLLDGGILSWQELFKLIEIYFDEREQNEIWTGLTDQGNWFNHIRIELERQKQHFLQQELGRDPLTWPKAINQCKILQGKKVNLYGIPGCFNQVGRFVPDSIEAGEFSNPMLSHDDIFNLMVHKFKVLAL